jgi:hypothetical protein
VSGAPDQVRMTRFPILVCTLQFIASPLRPFAHAATAPPGMLSCSGDAEVPFLRPSVSFLSSSSSPPSVFPQPALQAGQCPLRFGLYPFGSSSSMKVKKQHDIHHTQGGIGHGHKNVGQGQGE